MNDQSILDFSEQDFDQASKMMSTIMLANSARAQENVTDDGLKKLNPVQLAVFSKINIEASRLLREKPTSIHKHDSVTDLASKTLDDLKKRFEILDAEVVE
jgi:hypothetical protein